MSSLTMHERLPQRYQIRYGLIFAVLLAALLALFLIRAVESSLPPQTAPIPRSNNSTSSGATENTGAPTTDTNTPADRTVPSTSGGKANTILTP